jgi:enoyl-CoA hydratase/carnithine racemase
MSSSSIPLPSVGEHLILSTPAPHILMMKMNRPRQLNAMSYGMEQDMKKTLEWFEEEPSLWVVILTGNGRAFCAGQDLKSFLEAEENNSSSGPQDENLSAQARRIKDGGFGSVSCRRLSKPIIAAVDGPAMGGGTELVLNCDLVVATTRSIFALPEVARGVVAAMGGITRISDVAGHQRASEMLLVGEPLSAQDVYNRFNFVNALIPVDRSKSAEEGQAAIEAEAIRWAAKIVAKSPDAVLVTKEALNMARDAGKGVDGIDQVSLQSLEGQRSKALYDGANIREGLTAFFEVCIHVS